MHFITAPGVPHLFRVAFWIFICAGISLCTFSTAIWVAGMAGATELFAALVSYFLVSAGLLFTLYKMKS